MRTTVTLCANAPRLMLAHEYHDGGFRGSERILPTRGPGGQHLLVEFEIVDGFVRFTLLRDLDTLAAVDLQPRQVFALESHCRLVAGFIRAAREAHEREANADKPE